MHQTRHRESETESIIGSQNPGENWCRVCVIDILARMWKPGNKNGSLVFLKKRAGPNVNDMMMIRNRCHQELNLWKMTLSFQMTIVCLSDSESHIILTVDCKISAEHDALFARCFCVFCLSLYFLCLLSESVGTHKGLTAINWCFTL